MKTVQLRDNNFDLIRLFASIQVFFMHSMAWLKVSPSSSLTEIIDWFPGVPIFFMISGYLIPSSFAKSPSTIEYLRNRALRIFPGLWVCLGISYLLVAVRGELAQTNLLSKTVCWAFAQGTLFQFMDFTPNPGITNGALWSISTEVQFYILIPIAYLLGCKFGRNVKRWAALLIGMILVSSAIHAAVFTNMTYLLPRLFPTLYSSILANGYLFLFGVAAFTWRDNLLLLANGRAVYFIVLYLALRAGITIFGYSANMVHWSMLGSAVYAILGVMVFSIAHSFRGVSKALLKENDFSYGVYIYHMPIIYFLLSKNLHGGLALLLAIPIVAAFAVGSWFFVERPMLRFKHYSITREPNLKI